MANELRVIQGAAYDHRFSSVKDGAPFDLTAYTLEFYLWSSWGLDGEVIAASFTSADPRLVKLTQSGDTIGKWELHLTAAHTGALAQGMHRWACRAKNADAALTKWLVEPTDFYVAYDGDGVL